MTPSRRLVALASILLAVGPWGCGSKDSAPLVPAAAPTLTPSVPLHFRDPIEVTLVTATPGATIHYTVNDTAPTAASTTYDAPLQVSATTTVRAIATAPGMAPSPEASITYTQQPINLVLDQGTAEEVGGCANRPRYIFLNRFTLTADEVPFLLRSVRIMFHASTPVGTAVELVVYADDDGNPYNLGTSLLSLDTQVTTPVEGWSVYQLSPPILLQGTGALLIGYAGACSTSAYVPTMYACDEHATDWAKWGVWDSATTLPDLPDMWVGTGCAGMIRAGN